MDTEKLWKLFFATGLPQVYLAIGEQRRREADRLAPAAFRPADRKTAKV